MSDKPHCACLGMGDADECYELRYYGRSPAEEARIGRENGWDETCYCVCHEEAAAEAAELDELEASRRLK